MSGEIKKKKKTVGLVCNAEIGPAELESSRRSPRRRRLPTPTAAALSFAWVTATRARSPHRTLGEASRRRLLLTGDMYVDIMSVSSSWKASSIAGITSGLHSPCLPSPHDLRIPKRIFFFCWFTQRSLCCTTVVVSCASRQGFIVARSNASPTRQASRRREISFLAEVV